MEEIRQRKAQLIVQYGTSLVFVHEILGISSYLITFTLLYCGVVNVETVVNFLGWTEADLNAHGIDIHSKLITFAMTIALVKGLDVMGLVPLRWALTLVITPRVARFIGPPLDRFWAWAKSKWRTKKHTTKL